MRNFGGERGINSQGIAEERRLSDWSSHWGDGMWEWLGTMCNLSSIVSC